MGREPLPEEVKVFNPTLEEFKKYPTQEERKGKNLDSFGVSYVKQFLEE
jgi:hypothetical protein